MAWAARVGVVSAMASLCALVAANGCSASSSSPSAPPSPVVDSGSLVADSSAPPEDSAAAEDSGPMDGGGTCFPGQLTNFMPMFHAPVGPYLGLCTDTQIVKLIAACFGPAAQQKACDTWLADTANAKCLEQTLCGTRIIQRSPNYEPS